MALRPIETAIQDADGVPHCYRGSMLPTETGGNLLLELGEVLEGPLGSALKALAGGALPDEVMDGELADVVRTHGPAVMRSVLAGINVDGICGRLLRRGGFGLFRRLLSGMTRETRGADGQLVYLQVDVQTWFDEIYSGNLPELFKAVWWVAVENWLPFLRGSFSSGSEPATPAAAATETKMESAG